MTEATDDRLRLHIEAIELLESEKAGISEDIKERYSLAKGEGYDLKAMREVVKLRKLRADERMEQEAIRDTYKAAMGLA